LPESKAGIEKVHPVESMQKLLTDFIAILTAY
jgi:hypothetical protein